MDLTALSAGVRGTVVSASDPEWDDARLSEAGLGSPDAIVRVGSVDDVAAAVRFAASQGRPVAVRSGGHSAWNTLDGGIMIDLSGLAGVEVVGEGSGARVARVAGGARWGDVAVALQPHGLAISSGDTRSVGVGGLTLGGGIGWMVRAWGLAADQLVGVQLVTADGAIVDVDAESDPELWWALRGGGGNFGVVTRFDFTAHPVPVIAYADIAVEGDARPVLAALRDALAVAPRELTVTYMDVPEVDPSAPAGKSVTAVWAGDDVDALREALRPVLDLDQVAVRELGSRQYADILLEGPTPDPDQPMPGFIGGNGLVVDLDDAYIDAMASFRESTPMSVIFLRSLGGAFGDVAQPDSAFPARNATWFTMAGAFDIPEMVDEAERGRLTDAWDALDARSAGVYGNFSTSVDPSVAGRMYPGPTRTRLAAVKRAWDPGNLFSRNHNVAP